MQRNSSSRRRRFPLAALLFAAASSGALGFALSPTLAESANSPQTSQSAETPAKVAQKPRKPAKTKPQKQETEKKDVDKAASRPYSDVNDILPKLSPEEQIIVSAIGKEERLVDDVIAETGLPVGKVLATLTLLEVKGVVKRLPGKRVSLG